MALLIGLKGLPSDQSGLPQREELEHWWIEGMNAGVEWHAKKGSLSSSQTWHHPVPGIG